MSLLSVHSISLKRRGRQVLDDVSFDIAPGEFVGLLGPNGAGKTSVMRAALGLIPAATGTSSLTALTTSDRARKVAWMPQAREIAWPIPVEHLVSLGRMPYLSAGQSLPADDQAKVDAAIMRMGLENLRSRAASRLSGGEQARALIARALAQDTPLLMADEPAAGLDPAHQISTMKTFESLAREGRAALVSLHDLGLAARHCTRLILMVNGRVLADGSPAEVLTPDLMAKAYGISIWHQHSDQGVIFQPLDVL